MKWEIQRRDKPAGLRHNYNYPYIFHDLIDEDDNLLGWVREDVANQAFAPATNKFSSANSTWVGKNFTLEGAKAELITHFVKERLDNT